MNKPHSFIAFAAALAMVAPGARAESTLTIGTVNNGDMVVMQKLAPDFEKQHPDIKLRWVVLEENVLRQRLTTDIATKAGQFDVMTVGNYEVPIWAKQGWLEPMEGLPANYDTADLLKPVRDGISYNGKLYAAPFYGESAMTYYRTDLFQKAGITMAPAPTYAQIAEYAEKITDKANQVYGICLRGKPGWGENMAFVTPLVTSFGGQWFNEQWKATLVASGRCGMWIDSTVAAGLLFDPKQSQVSDKVGFAPMPTGDFKGGPTWLWSWNLGIPASSKQKEAAKTFVAWATSKDYVKLVAGANGWVAVPPGTRQSTYDDPDYKKVAPFADFVQKAIDSANPTGSTKAQRPYTGAQFVAIPEFQGIGTQVGQTVASTLTGASVETALKTAESATERTMKQAGYPK